MLRRRLVCSYSNISGNFSLFRNFSLTLNNLALPDSSISKLQPFITKLAIEKARPRTFDPKFDDSPARAKIFPRPNPPQDVAQRFSPQVKFNIFCFFMHLNTKQNYTLPQNTYLFSICMKNWI